MRLVEDAALRVAEASEQQSEADRPVRDVRRRQREPPAGARPRPYPSEEATGVAKMLDQVAAHDRVERAGLERQLDRLDVADHALLVEAARPFGRLGVELDPDHRAAALDEALGKVAGREIGRA